MKIFKINAPPFPGFVTVISGTFEELAKELIKRGFDEQFEEVISPGDYAMTLKIPTRKGTAIAILLLSEVPNSIIWHECLHAAWYIIDAFGVQINVGNHEILTYMQGYLYEKIHKKLEI